MRYKLFVTAGIMAGLAASAHAQASAAPSAASKASEGPEAASGFGKDANYATLEGHQRGGIGFIGKVVVQDAMFPWDPIPIVVTCNGVVRYRTDADAKGNFQLVGSKTDPMHSEITPEAADPHEQTASHLIGCDAQAELAGFTSTKVHIANLDIMDNPDIGTITLRPDKDAVGSTQSATTTTANPEAMKRFNKARAEFQSGNMNGAERDLQKAVQVDPKFADAWYQLGKLQQANNQTPDALSSEQKAIVADPKFISPYERLAEDASVEKKWPDALNATTQALKLDPEGNPRLWYFDGLAKLNTGDADGAEASIRKSLAMDPQHTEPNSEQLLAVILAGKGELEEALKHLQNSLTYVTGPNADVIKQQIAQIQSAMPQAGK